MTPFERAARALALAYICARDNRKPDDEYAQQYANAAWQSHSPQVAAVLKAIREPSEDMIREGCLADFPGGRYGESTFTEAQIGKEDAPVIWQAMIDAALIEGASC